MINSRRERHCFAITAERKYYHVGKTFIKRSLRPDEWQVSQVKGVMHIPRLSRERILNEGATLNYIRENTNIPVPQLYACFEDSDAAYLVMEYVSGVGMHKLAETQRKVVMKELQSHVATLRQLRSRRIGGVDGDDGHFVVPPYRVLKRTHRDVWNLRPADKESKLVFCHNDLSQYHVIVDPETLKIKSIIDWEYAGFYPEYFDRPFYLRSGSSAAAATASMAEGEEDDAQKLLEFLKSHIVCSDSGYYLGSRTEF